VVKLNVQVCWILAGMVALIVSSRAGGGQRILGAVRRTSMWAI